MVGLWFYRFMFIVGGLGVERLADLGSVDGSLYKSKRPKAGNVGA
jgi:hypothetical protein